MFGAALEEARGATVEVARAYIAGAGRDGTFNSTHRTLRISQAHPAWLDLLQILFATLGKTSWIYRESPARSVWTIETSLSLESSPPLRSASALSAFARGYFDAEGGIPRDPAARFYIQLCQKDRTDLLRLRRVLGSLGIHTGRLHNPSRAVDPDYWRMYVSSASHERFAEVVGSWHPVKRSLLRRRFPAA